MILAVKPPTSGTAVGGGDNKASAEGSSDAKVAAASEEDHKRSLVARARTCRALDLEAIT